MSRIFPINPLSPSLERYFPRGNGNVALPSGVFGRQMMSLSHTWVVLGRFTAPGPSPGRFLLRNDGNITDLWSLDVQCGVNYTYVPKDAQYASCLLNTTSWHITLVISRLDNKQKKFWIINYKKKVENHIDYVF